MHMCVYIMCPHRQHMCVCSCSHTGKRPEKNLGRILLYHPPVYYSLETDLLNPDLHWCPLKPKHLPFFSSLKHWRKKKKSHHTWVFIWVLEIWTQVLTVAQQMFLSTESHPHTPKDGCYYYYNSFHRIPLITAEGQGSGSATQKPPSPSLSKVILQKLTYFLAMICKVSVDLNY